MHECSKFSLCALILLINVIIFDNREMRNKLRKEKERKRKKKKYYALFQSKFFDKMHFILVVEIKSF